jgi:diguanylate cyclase (GGDEF)-like protein/PAS domain S-box-containing protein
VFNFLTFYKRNFIGQWLLLFSFFAFIIISISGYYYYNSQKNEQMRIGVYELSLLKIAKAGIEHSFEAVEKDINFLANNPHLKNILAKPSQANIKEYSKECQLFSFYGKVYDQIRWIDEYGKEKVRVDYRKEFPIIVTLEELQDKKNRYYFTETIKLGFGEIYYSPFDLNIENNKIESPYKPMIRIATPVFDNNKTKRGIFIINYLGKELLNKFTINTSGTLGESMLLNQDGYWLKASKKEDEWGFMFENNQANISFHHPLAWERIQKKENGQFLDDDGLWSFETVHPFVSNASAHNYYFKAVSFIPAKTVDAVKKEQLKNLLFPAGSALFLAILATFLIIYYRRKQNQTQQNLMQASIIIEQVNDAVLITDRDGIITFSNLAAELQTGYSSKELLGKNPNILKSGKHSLKEYQAIWKTILAGKVFRGTLINKRKNGELYYEDKTITPIKDESGEIINFVSTGKDVTLTSLNHQQTEHIAQTDLLTGIHNRYQLQKLYLLEHERAQRYSLPFSMILIDIDDFKKINDTYGHDTGDKVLQHLVHVVQKNLRNIDIFARWGGEEFLVLSPNADLNAAKTIAEKLCTVVANFSFPVVGHVTISLGISTFQADDSFETMFNRADSGLYSAKEQGKNRVGEA